MYTRMSAQVGEVICNYVERGGANAVGLTNILYTELMPMLNRATAEPPEQRLAGEARDKKAKNEDGEHIRDQICPDTGQ